MIKDQTSCSPFFLIDEDNQSCRGVHPNLGFCTLPLKVVLVTLGYLHLTQLLKAKCGNLN